MVQRLLHTERIGMRIYPIDDFTYSKEIIDSKLANVTPTQNIGNSYTKQIIYVNLGGNDTTATGSYESSYLTISAALNSITDNSSTKRYVISIGPGNYLEAGFSLKPYIHLIGSGFHTRLTLTSNIFLGTLWNNVTGRTGLFNMLLSGSGGNGLTLNLQSVGNISSGTLSCVVEMGNVHVNGTVLFTARTTADTLEWWNCQFLNTMTFQGGAILLKNCYAPISIVINTSGAGDNNTNIDIQDTSVDTLNISSNLSLSVSFSGGTIYTSITISNSTTTFSTFKLPNIFTTDNLATLVLLNSGKGINYTPLNPSYWNVQPKSIADAIDKIAAKIGNVTPI